MPTAAPRACHCGRIACTQHRRASWQSRPDRPRRTGDWLQRRRLELCVQAGAACARCHRLTPLEAGARDHRVPLAEGGADDYTNDQWLCHACHATKTQAEAARGVHRLAPRGSP